MDSEKGGKKFIGFNAGAGAVAMEGAIGGVMEFVKPSAICSWSTVLCERSVARLPLLNQSNHPSE